MTDGVPSSDGMERKGFAVCGGRQYEGIEDIERVFEDPSDAKVYIENQVDGFNEPKSEDDIEDNVWYDWENGGGIVWDGSEFYKIQPTLIVRDVDTGMERSGGSDDSSQMEGK